MICKKCRQCDKHFEIENPSKYFYKKLFKINGKNHYHYFCSEECFELNPLKTMDEIITTKSGLVCHKIPKEVCKNCINCENSNKCPLLTPFPTEHSKRPGYYYCNFKVEV